MIDGPGTGFELRGSQQLAAFPPCALVLDPLGHPTPGQSDGCIGGS